MKVACERIVLDGAASAMVIRPGLIVGPGDPTGRFTYWPRRLAAGGEVLAPGDPADVMQVADVRDLAAWAVTACEQRTTGVYDGVGRPCRSPTCSRSAPRASTPDVTWTWVDQEFLQEQEVEPWMGPGSIPLWLPRPEYDGLPAHDVQPSLDAGLTIRPLADTTRDTLAWLEATPDAVVSGIDLDRERELLDGLALPTQTRLTGGAVDHLRRRQPKKPSTPSHHSASMSTIWVARSEWTSALPVSSAAQCVPRERQPDGFGSRGLHTGANPVSAAAAVRVSGIAKVPDRGRVAVSSGAISCSAGFAASQRSNVSSIAWWPRSLGWRLLCDQLAGLNRCSARPDTERSPMKFSPGRSWFAGSHSWRPASLRESFISAR